MFWQIILITAILIEAVTIFVRFFFKISTRDVLYKVMHRYGWKRVIHFHHLFFGIIVVLVAIYLGNDIIRDLGLGIVLSDVLHHWVVLWLVVGNPEFHLVYKNMKMFKKEQKMEDLKIRKFLGKFIVG